jgi:catechol 2,3-dioxygenase-like lactoylglutathione lyase family enzyme
MKVVLGDVAVVVSDAKKSAQWWKKLGFEIRDKVGHWITVAPPGANVVIHLCEEGEYKRDAGNTGIGFFVDDVAEVEAAWRKKGVTFSVPRKVGEASIQARFLDPDGNEFWMFEDEDLRSDAKPAKKAKSAKTAKKSAKKAKASRRR